MAIKAIKAIETKHKGYRFRSRIEARWAIFFDVLNFDWLYEPEGFKFAELGCYLPDFLVTMSVGPTWVEVKPMLPESDALEKITDKLSALAQLKIEGYTGFSSFLLCGTPGDSITPGIFATAQKGKTYMSPTMSFGECPFCSLACLIGIGKEWFTVYCSCLTNQSVRRAQVRRSVLDRCIKSERMMQAYEIARSARFEHGESPRVLRGRQNA